MPRPPHASVNWCEERPVCCDRIRRAGLQQRSAHASECPLWVFLWAGLRMAERSLLWKDQGSKSATTLWTRVWMSALSFFCRVGLTVAKRSRLTNPRHYIWWINLFNVYHVIRWRRVVSYKIEWNHTSYVEHCENLTFFVEGVRIYKLLIPKKNRTVIKFILLGTTCNPVTNKNVLYLTVIIS